MGEGDRCEQPCGREADRIAEQRVWSDVNEREWNPDQEGPPAAFACKQGSAHKSPL